MIWISRRDLPDTECRATLTPPIRASFASRDWGRRDRVGSGIDVGRPAADALKKLGPVAEPAVIEVLGDRDRSAQRYAVEVLRAIGTGRSLGPLKKLAEENALLKGRAEAAAKAIEERVNAPVT